MTSTLSVRTHYRHLVRADRAHAQLRITAPGNVPGRHRAHPDEIAALGLSSMLDWATVRLSAVKP